MSTALETAVRRMLAELGPIEADRPTVVVPVRAAALEALARALDEPWVCSCKAWNGAGRTACGMCGVQR